MGEKMNETRLENKNKKILKSFKKYGFIRQMSL